MKKSSLMLRKALDGIPANNKIQITRYNVNFGQGSQMVRKVVFLHFSDLQSKWFGEGQSKLKTVVERLCQEEKPDFAVFTGDLIDRRFTDYEAGKCFCEIISQNLKLYYVNGNHEVLLGKECEEFVNDMKGMLYNISGRAMMEQSGVVLAGIDERWVYGARGFDRKQGVVNEESLSSKVKEQVATVKESDAILSSDARPYFKPVVLLSHEPQLTKLYDSCGCDLVLAGHGHGGQVRLPFVGGLYAPEQGVLPKLTEGIHKRRSLESDDDYYLIVNRGLGNSRFPLRIFNRPEIGIITLTFYGEVDTVKE